jgi:hypothetical protein
MKHKSYKGRHRKSLSRSIRRTKNTKRLRRHTKRLRRHTKKYRLRGGNTAGVKQAPLPEPVFQPMPPPLPPDALGVQAKLAADAAAQNAANHNLAGGKKRYLKQRGGDATICGGTAANAADGYGYIPPNNCLLVPTVYNSSAQDLANNAMHTLNRNTALAVGDNQVRVMPK